MVRYNLHNFIYLTVKGAGPLFKNLELQFSRCAFDASQILDERENLEIEISPILLGNLLLGKLSKDCYHRDRERFIIMRNGAALELDGMQKIMHQRRLRIEGHSDIGLVMLMIEALIRFKVIGHRVVLLHAAAVAKMGQTILLPAWKSSGKTSACLATGSFSAVQLNEMVFSFLRRGEKQVLFVAVNRSEAAQSFWLPSNLHPGNGSLLMGNFLPKNKLPAKGFVIFSFPQNG